MENLITLLERLEYECIQGSLDKIITEIVYDSRKVTKDCLFVCIKGAAADGHAFAKDAAAEGASVIVAQEPIDAGPDVTVIKVSDTRYALACLSAAYFHDPAK